jgi:hypothetical protein
MRNVLVAACLSAAAGFVAAPAYADPAHDPHMPNMQAGYCPGGGMGSQISLAYCDEPAPPGGCGGAVPPPP